MDITASTATVTLSPLEQLQASVSLISSSGSFSNRDPDAEAMLRDLGTPTTMVTATAESLERIAGEKKVLERR